MVTLATVQNGVGDGGIVLHHQNQVSILFADLGSRCGGLDDTDVRARGVGARFRCAQRQGDVKGRALPDDTVHPHAPAAS